MFEVGERVRVVGTAHIAHDIIGLSPAGFAAFGCGKSVVTWRLTRTSSRDPRCKSCLLVETKKNRPGVAALLSATVERVAS